MASDRHVCIFDPVTREVHELIQFDEHAPDTPLTNQALGWGVWKDGVLIEEIVSLQQRQLYLL